MINFFFALKNLFFIVLRQKELEAKELKDPLVIGFEQRDFCLKRITRDTKESPLSVFHKNVFLSCSCLSFVKILPVWENLRFKRTCRSVISWSANNNFVLLRGDASNPGLPLKGNNGEKQNGLPELQDLNAPATEDSSATVAVSRTGSLVSMNAFTESQPV